MKKIFLCFLVLFMFTSVYSQVVQDVRERKGNYGDAKGRLIGWNDGVGQILISSQTALYGDTDWLIMNDPSGYTMFIDTSVVITTSPASGMDSEGFLKMGFPLYPGTSTSLKGRNGSPWYGICPISSTTISIIETRIEPAGNALHNRP